MDGDGLSLRLEPEVGAYEVGDVGQLGVDELGGEVREVEVHVVAVGPDAATGADLGEDAARHHVAGCQVLDGRRVALHEALVLGVAQDAALGARCLRQEDPELVDAGGVELEELHVLHGDAAPVQQPRSVAR